jgi:hypothetical protein
VRTDFSDLELPRWAVVSALCLGCLLQLLLMVLR